MTLPTEQSKEVGRLDDIAAVSRYGHGANRAMIAHSFRIFERYRRPGPILEMGPAEGHMTEPLAALGQRMTVVEGAAAFCESLRTRFPTIDVVHALFEDFTPVHKFETIVLGHVLEHVEDPVDILRRARLWLSPTGCLMAAVPNARSLHRQAAVLLGLLGREDELNETDRHHGHRRVFNPETFRHAFLAAGLTIEVFGGYWLKPLSNGQIERNWTPAMLEAFMSLGERYPDIAAELYVIARSEA